MKRSFDMAKAVEDQIRLAIESARLRRVELNDPRKPYVLRVLDEEIAALEGLPVHLVRNIGRDELRDWFVALDQIRYDRHMKMLLLGTSAVVVTESEPIPKGESAVQEWVRRARLRRAK